MTLWNPQSATWTGVAYAKMSTISHSHKNYVVIHRDFENHLKKLNAPTVTTLILYALMKIAKNPMVLYVSIKYVSVNSIIKFVKHYRAHAF